MQVKCVDNLHSPKLTLGKVYQVVRSDSTFYFVINDVGVEEEYFKRRFQVVSEEAAPSTSSSLQVRCVKSDGVGLSLTLGKVYPVVREDTEYYYVVNDNGNQVGYFKNRFEIVSFTSAPTPTLNSKELQSDPEEERLRKLFRFQVDPRYECAKCGGTLPCNWH